MSMPVSSESGAEISAGKSGRDRKRFTALSEALDDARRRAQAIVLPEPLLDFLYSRTRCRSMSRSEWEREIRVATALDENFTRFCSMPLVKDVGRSVDKESRKAVVRELQSAGNLVLGFHGGFGYMRRRLFGRMFPQGIIIGATTRHSAADGAHALFAAREALLSGGAALIAPDGRFGKESGLISILGAQLPITDGAPFLAHSTGCSVIWLALVRIGDTFTFKTTSAPRREEGESFSSYRERFYRFYGDQLEEAFTGDPANLPLILNWKLTFNAMLAGKVYRVRRPTRQFK
ncbi:MAG TPA: hypothetical protein VHU18_09445 [Rhizomicrobium sp.]|jgi:hypothetical protein|nr:hypothetical protein [Rhizomicrobium sp.]